MMIFILLAISVALVYRLLVHLHISVKVPVPDAKHIIPKT